jgi:hypothetical protein
VIFAIMLALLLVAGDGVRRYLQREAQPACETELPQVARFTRAPLAGCEAQAGTPAGAPPRLHRPPLKVDRAAFAGEISGSWLQSAVLSFEGPDLVLGTRASWAKRIVGLPLVTLIVVLFGVMAAFVLGGLARLVALPLNRIASRFLRPGGDGKERVLLPSRWTDTVVAVLVALATLGALGWQVARAGKFTTLRFSPAQASVTSQARYFGIAFGSPAAQSYHLVVPVAGAEGGISVNVYGLRPDGSLEVLHRVGVQGERAATLARLLEPAWQSRL